MVLLVLLHSVLMWTTFFCHWTGCAAIPAEVTRMFPAEPKKEGLPEAVEATAKYSGRLTSSFLGMAYLIVCVVGLAVGGRIFYQSIAVDVAVPIRWIALVAAALIGFWIVLYLMPALHMPLMQSLGPRTIDLDLAGATANVDRLNALGYISAMLLSLTVYTVLYRLRDATDLKQLGKGMKSLNSILYAGTLILIVGIIFEKALLQWAFTFTSRYEPLVKAADSFTAALLAYDGGYYTLLLAALYLPAAFMLRRQGARLVDHDPKALEQYGLNFSFTESLPRMFAILGPLLAGPVGELFGRLSK
ncbi:MAG: hypothetical protein QOK48_489 [Blastocatellia bacterium]|nr:hypothetical protein [Blastocatellia bacterium]